MGGDWPPDPGMVGHPNFPHSDNKRTLSRMLESPFFCGKGGIRTLGGPEPTTVFETVPFNHSGTFPELHHTLIFLNIT
jgi:hypothetical protein